MTSKYELKMIKIAYESRAMADIILTVKQISIMTSWTRYPQNLTLRLKAITKRISHLWRPQDSKPKTKQNKI